MSRLRRVVLVSLVVVVAAPIASVSAGTQARAAAVDPVMIEAGTKIYRQFCGQCHALKEARAVGFGSAHSKGVGEDGGPSFNPLKISYAMCMASVTMLFGGHEKVVRKMSWKQLKDVAKYLQYATRKHPIVARFSDG